MSGVTRHQAAGAFQRWQPPDFDRPEPEPVEEQAGEVEGQDAADADQRGYKLPTAEEVEEIFESARKSGYQAGYEEGTARGRVEAMELHGLVESLDKALESLDVEVAEQLLDLAVELAQQLVRRELRAVPEGIVDVVREALQQFPQNHALIHLHPKDAALVREYLKEQLAHLGHRLIEDDAMARGGCRIESSGSELDATLQTRWRRIMGNLGREDPLLATDPDEDG